MPKPVKDKPDQKDVNELAFDLVRRVTEEEPPGEPLRVNLSKYMAEIGRGVKLAANAGCRR